MVRVYSPYKPRQKSRTLLAGVFIVIFLFVVGAWNMYSLLRGLPRPERITERAVVESTKIYDRTGKVLLYEIHGEEKRTIIPLSEIPPRINRATLAAEDINFYQHGALDFKGILRALFKNVVRGDITQGGSTITQQLVKNSILTGERTLTRKLKEVVLALLLETKYSKDEIFALYLNQIPYGSNAYGIAAAAQTYFAKTPAELSLAEAATLAALPRAPTYYSPHGSHKEELLKRKNWILGRMAEAGFISSADKDRALRERLSFAPPRQSIRAPHFVMYVREYLNDKYGEEFVERGGLKVTTTLDWQLQEEAEKIIKEGAEKNEGLVKAANAALVALDPQTGEILSMVGSKDYLASPYPDECAPGINCRFDPHVNVTTRPRQPGSAFKPFVYATAFKKGYTPETVLFDVPTEFNPLCNPDGSPGPAVKEEKDCYHPQNYDETFRGPVSLRQAIAQSLNLPSVKLLYLAGVTDSIKTAQDLGITTLTEPDRYGLSLVLGGAEVTLLEMTSAFGVFAQDGVLRPKTAILRIENSRGTILEEKKESSLPVLDTEVARTINDVLSDNDARVPVFNQYSSLYFPGRRVAAKTGTTQDSRDAWVIGYAPSIAVGVWVGNNDNSPMQRSSLSVMVAGPLWHQFLVSALNSRPPEEFTPPASRTSEKPVLRGNYRSGPVIKIDKISRKLATAYTPVELIEEMGAGEIESILTLIKKEDPAGPPPDDPTTDPQYKNWSAGIRQWLDLHKLPLAEPPREFDTIHAPDKRPRIEFVLPAPDKQKNISSITTTIISFFQLREVSLFIDDELIDSRTSSIVSPITFPLGTPLPAGTHKVRVSAYDIVGNTATKEIAVQSQ